MKTVLILVGVAVLTACGGGSGEGEGESKVEVAAAFYPVAEAARQVGGDRVAVRDLTPPGAEPHDLELGSDEVDAILDADLVVMMGGGFQPGLEDVAADRDGATIAVLDELDASNDPHVWLDPGNMIKIVGLVADGLAQVDPDGAGTYEAAAAAYITQLASLDTEMEAGLATCERDEIVTAHEAFGWLAKRYGLTQEAVAGLSPDQEPDPARLAELADLVRAEGVTTIFTEELVSPDVAGALAREAGVRTAVLNPLEGLTQDEIDAGDDYVSVMHANLATLREALGCT
jgi:zinc transport system substrate-binding protein